MLTVVGTLVAAKVDPGAEVALTWKRALLGVAGVAIVAATFFFLLPKIADYRDVWDVVKKLSWEWLVGLRRRHRAEPRDVRPAVAGRAAAASGSSRRSELTQASTALSLVLPAGMAAGLGVSFGMLRSWGFPGREITRGMTLVEPLEPVPQPLLPDRGGVPAHGARRGRRSSPRPRSSASRSSASWSPASCSRSRADGSRTRSARSPPGSRTGRSGRSRRGPVGWGGPSFERFRASAGELLRAPLARAHALVARRQPERLPRAARLPARARRPGVGGLGGRGVRRLGARAPARDDPDHARRRRRRRARPHDAR